MIYIIHVLCYKCPQINRNHVNKLNKEANQKVAKMGCHGSKSDGISKHKLKLFVWPGSAPCRAVMMTAKGANIDIAIEKVNIFKGEHKTNNYTKVGTHMILIINFFFSLTCIL